MKRIRAMKRHTMSIRQLLILSTVMGLAFAGCVKTHRYSVKEARDNPTLRFDQAVVPSQISAALLEVTKSSLRDSSQNLSLSPVKNERAADSLAQTQQVLLQFNADGGRIIRDSELVVGTGLSGEPVALPFDSVISLQYRLFDRGLAFMSVRDALAAQDMVRSHPGRKVPRHKFPNWSFVEFTGSGGTIDTSKQKLVGMARSGKEVSVALDDVAMLSTSASFLNQCKRHPYRVVRFAAVATILALVSFGPIHHQF